MFTTFSLHNYAYMHFFLHYSSVIVVDQHVFTSCLNDCSSVFMTTHMCHAMCVSNCGPKVNFT